MQWADSHSIWVKPGTIRILVVDGHPLLREGVAAIIRDQPDLQLAGEAANGLEAIEQHRALRPDVTLMDLQIPRMSGIDAMIAIREETPKARIIVLTTYTGDVPAQRALKAGASAYLLKGLAHKDLPDTIRAVHRGVKRIEPAIATQIADHASESALTTREVEVLSLVAAGNSNKLIASALDINEETAKTHVKNILAKLSANDRTHAVTLGLRRGIIELERGTLE
jgi:DNA-binding NarL/FixJ family response regulator